MLPVSLILLPGFLAFGLLGCAAPGPRYQTAYRYEPPADAASRACLEKIGQNQMQCQQHCSTEYQACLKIIEPQGQARYAEVLKRYEIEMHRYNGELSRYQIYLSMSRGWSPWGGYYGYYHPWPEPYYPPPVPPTKPSLEQEMGRLRQEKCEVDCGCQAAYDVAYLSCGGKRIPEQKCIANCPQVK